VSTEDRLAIIVVNYNSHELLSTHLARAQLESVPARVIVVDNSEAAAERAGAESVCDQQGWDYLPAGGNIGFGAGANLGADRALALGLTELMFLNPDAWVEVATARSLWEACRREPLVARSPVIRRPDGRAWFSAGSINLANGRVRTSPGTQPPAGPQWLTGTCFVVSSLLWHQTGGFDERYFLYWEDVDLSWRILHSGGQLQVDAGLSAQHLVGGTQPGAGKSPQFIYYNSRNRLLFASLHLTRRQQAGWVLGTPRMTWELVGLGGRNAAAWGAGVRGTSSGLIRLLAVRPTRRRRATSRGEGSQSWRDSVLPTAPGSVRAMTGGRAHSARWWISRPASADSNSVQSRETDDEWGGQSPSRPRH
jgi:GT2 family glycosyltransferase